MSLFTETIALLVKADTDAAVKPLSKLEKQSKSTDKAFVGMTRSATASADVLTRGLAQLGSLALGAGLVATVTALTKGYVDAATAANTLSKATNSTVKASSQFLALGEKFGLDLNDVVEIFADFQQAVGQYGDELDALGVSLAKNADGTTDWIATSVGFLDTIGEIGDATERNRLLFKFFGEEGAKQLIGLSNAGLDLAEALAEIEGLDVEDVRRAQEYQRAMRELSSAGTELKQTLGAALAGLATDAANVAVPLAEVVGSVDAGTVAIIGMAAAAPYAGRKIRELSASFQEFNKNGKGFVGVAKGVGTTLALAAAWEVGSRAVDSYDEKVRIAAQSSGALTDEMIVGLEESLSTRERWALELKNLFNVDAFKARWGLDGGEFGKWGGTGRDAANRQLLLDDIEEYRRKEKELADAQGPAAAAALEQRDAQKALNDALADGVDANENLTVEVINAARAQRDQELASERAEGAIDAYAAATWDAVDATLALFDKTYAARAAQRDFRDSVEEGNKALGSTKDLDDRQAALDEIVTSALRAASSESEAARQQDLLNGIYRDATYYAGLTAKELRELAETPGIPKAARDEINGLAEDLETAQETASQGIGIPVEIKIPTGEALEARVTELQNRIREAGQRGDEETVITLQAELDILTNPETGLVPPQTVAVNPTVSPEASAAVTANLAELCVPKEVDINPFVTEESQDEVDGVLSGLTSRRTVWLDVKVSGIGAAELSANQDLNGNGIIGQALRPYGAMAYLTAPGRTRGSDGAVAYSVAGGRLEPRFAEAAGEQMQVVIMLDGRQIAQRLEPVTRQRRAL